jgi:phosphohistidine swiveling domain-containing protein
LTLIVRFDSPGCADKELVGGKGANLGLCAGAGLPVPPGFTVTTTGYGTFLTQTGLDRVIGSALAELDFADIASVEDRMADVRAAIVATALPAELLAEIHAGYGTLGAETHVAVRSSGTAEDLAEASFAGLHDTFLHVRGADGVAEAVRRCWASMWTARATIYRHQHGLNDVAKIRMAVVIQEMVDAEVSGVMFTANPATTATDELVINASWGLGEVVVQGLVTPDEYVVKVQRPAAVGFDQRLTPLNPATTLRVKRTTVGNKDLQMVRDPETGHNTVTEAVPENRQSVPSLSDAQVLELADLGRRVQSFYEDIPQDIEWAFNGGQFYVLQSRPITGVDFDWAADIESFQWAPDDENDLFTLAFADLLTGVKSPLYYHWMAENETNSRCGIGNLLGLRELMGPAFTMDGLDVNRPAPHRTLRYFRGELYLNTEAEKLIVENAILPWLRSPNVSPWISPEEAEEVRAKPFSYKDFVASYARLHLNEPKARLFTVLDHAQTFVNSAVHSAKPAELPDMATLSDEELKRRLDDQWYVIARVAGWAIPMAYLYAPQMYPLLARMIGEWYSGDNEMATAELCQGVDVRSKTLEENVRMYGLVEQIRGSEKLSALFEQHKDDGSFFDVLEHSAEGRNFLEDYREFVRAHGHRGHEDRDFGYPRRFEDPTVDIRSFKLLLAQTSSVSPYIAEQQLTARREAVLADVMDNVRRSGLTGPLKVKAIQVVYDWIQQFLPLRDDVRWAYEQSSLCAKLYCREIGRRCTERGFLADPEDFLMFSKEELFDMLAGRAGVKLVRAKAVARRRDYDRAIQRTYDFPAYMRDGREVKVGAAAGGPDDGGLAGLGWTSGTITATARVVNRLSEADRVQPGEILVCQSTDPGWSAVFMLISGIVLETGGLLSHAVCISREYGLPAVQLAGARKLIPDGALITINGSTGEVILVEEHPEAIDSSGEPSGERMPREVTAG